jgi:dTDP-4-dehydrorhamnose 3,5-epimerase
VTTGSVYDVVVDLRKNSPTFGKWEGFLLSAENKKMLFVPRGFAHGFVTIEDDTEFLYKCDDVYDPGYE